MTSNFNLVVASVLTANIVIASQGSFPRSIGNIFIAVLATVYLLFISDDEEDYI